MLKNDCRAVKRVGSVLIIKDTFCFWLDYVTEVETIEAYFSDPVKQHQSKGIKEKSI